MDLKPSCTEDTENDGQNGVQKSKKWKNPFNAQQRKEEKERRQKKRSRLIVRNISYKITEEDLRKFFEKWGTLEDVNILKRADGKLVGCAFVQYETVNQATKAILKCNNQELLGRTVFVDWALGKNEYVAKNPKKETKIEKTSEDKIDTEIKQMSAIKSNLESKDEDIKSEDDVQTEDNDNEGGDDENSEDDEDAEDDEDDEDDEDAEDDEGDEDDEDDEDEDDEDDEEKKKVQLKLNLGNIGKEKRISNDVQEGCTVFIKNVPFDCEENDLRKACRKYGPLYYAIINKDHISGHSKGTAFVKFKTKESADLCLQTGTEFVIMDQVLDPHPAMSREEISNQSAQKSKDEVKDSRNLYLAREGLIMSGSKAADGVSTSDMAKRHKLEQNKTEVLKNLNRFVSRNRLSVHNLPLNYDNEKLKQMAIAYTTFKPHECRVMRENKVTPEHPSGKSKGFGFMSFNTHREALTALRKLNNNPKVFGTLHRPIVAFSIEDRAVYNIKEKRKEKSKLNNPTFQEKLAKQKELRKERFAGKVKNLPKGPMGQTDDKLKLKKQIQKLEKARSLKPNASKQKQHFDSYVGMESKPGTSIRMRSNKKINEQAEKHLKRVKGEKKKIKQRKIKKINQTERGPVSKPKQERSKEHDDLVHKYKRMIDSKAADSDMGPKAKKSKRNKWYTE